MTHTTLPHVNVYERGIVHGQEGGAGEGPVLRIHLSDPPADVPVLKFAHECNPL